VPAEYVTVIIEYRTLPDSVAPAFAEIEGLIRTVVASEPDCHGIRLLQDTQDPTRMLLYEEWSSREAYFGPHLLTAHLCAFKAKAPSLFAGPPVIHVWQQQAAYVPSTP